MDRRQADGVTRDFDRDESKRETGSKTNVDKSDDPTASTGLSLDRRDCLTTIGALIAGPAVATGSVRAAEEGYGSGGFGAGAYGGATNGDDRVEQSLAVATRGVVGVDESSATLKGDLTELVGYDSATVRIRWAKSGGSFYYTTSGQTLESPGEFNAQVTGLESDTEYVFNAYAEAGDDSDAGAIESFTTDPNSVPEISVLKAKDTSNHKNPHVDASIEWTATIDEGELEAAELSVSDADGEVLSWRYNLGGQTAEGSEVERIKHGNRNSSVYTVELTVYSAHGTTQTRSNYL